MKKSDDNVMDARVGWNDIAKMVSHSHPQRRAYLIIRNFFNTENPDDRICMEFKEWFLSEDTQVET